jgi:hypothetical protein
VVVGGMKPKFISVAVVILTSVSTLVFSTGAIVLGTSALFMVCAITGPLNSATPIRFPFPWDLLSPTSPTRLTGCGSYPSYAKLIRRSMSHRQGLSLPLRLGLAHHDLVPFGRRYLEFFDGDLDCIVVVLGFDYSEILVLRAKLHTPTIHFTPQGRHMRDRRRTRVTSSARRLWQGDCEDALPIQ